jgi:hypothetical protein
VAKFNIGDRVKHYLDLNKHGIVIEVDNTRLLYDSYCVSWDSKLPYNYFYFGRALIGISPLEQLAEAAE